MLQPLDDFLTQRSIARHFRIHLVVGNGCTTLLGILSPRRWIARWIVGLTQDRSNEDIAGRSDGANYPVFHFHSPQQRGFSQYKRLCIATALGIRLTAVEGVVYLGLAILGSNGNGDTFLLVESMRQAELRLCPSCRCHQQGSNRYQAILLHHQANCHSDARETAKVAGSSESMSTRCCCSS